MDLRLWAASVGDFLDNRWAVHFRLSLVLLLRITPMPPKLELLRVPTFGIIDLNVFSSFLSLFLYFLLSHSLSLFQALTLLSVKLSLSLFHINSSQKSLFLPLIVTTYLSTRYLLGRSNFFHKDFLQTFVSCTDLALPNQWPIL